MDRYSASLIHVSSFAIVPERGSPPHLLATWTSAQIESMLVHTSSKIRLQLSFCECLSSLLRFPFCGFSAMLLAPTPPRATRSRTSHRHQTTMQVRTFRGELNCCMAVVWQIRRPAGLGCAGSYFYEVGFPPGFLKHGCLANRRSSICGGWAAPGGWETF